MNSTHNIYVIELEPNVLSSKKFRDRNPDYIEGKPCVYVGMTGKDPEERFKDHKKGYKANKYAKEYRKHLIKRHFEKLNPVTYEKPVEMERSLAEELQRQGYGVWWN